MPGPGQKKKSRPKPRIPSSTGNGTPPTPSFSADAYVDDVDHAGGWNAIVLILCTVFEIPDLTTRTGLKKVHANFETIFNRLDGARKKHPNNSKIAGGIVGIYAKMCADSLLRDKLFAKGLLEMLLPLLEDDFSRYMALRALVTISTHSGRPTRLAVAKHTPKLVGLVERYPDDKKLAELVITVLSHTVVVLLDGDKPADPALLKSIDMRSILKLITETTMKQWVSSLLTDHSILLLSTATLHASEACKSYLPMQKLLVAGLRSIEWVTRCICLGGMIRLHQSDSEFDRRVFNPMKLVSALHTLPRHLAARLEAYGRPRCEIYITYQTTGDYQNAMMAYAQDKDLYSLGLKLASYITRTEFSIGEGMFQSQDSRIGHFANEDLGLPFTRWTDALPLCSRAIRAKGDPEDADPADIIDVKFHIMRQRIPAAVELARKGLKRNPDCAYFYYAITLAANHVDGLRAAKKGLKCKNITPFVRFQLMQRAVEHAGDMGLEVLGRSPTAGQAKWEEGIAFLMSAFEDAKTFVEQAPPDNRHMGAVLYWYILLTIAIKGPELSIDLRELENTINALKIADDFANLVGPPPPKTIMRLGQQTVLKLYSTAAIEFGNVIAKVDAGQEPEQVSPSKLEDDLAAWLEDAHIHDGHGDGGVRGLHPKVNTNSVKLYRCSWCGTPSAVLRKCSGCAQTRYCDVGCQRQHWADHRRICKTAS